MQQADGQVREARPPDVNDSDRLGCTVAVAVPLYQAQSRLIYTFSHHTKLSSLEDIKNIFFLSFLVLGFCRSYESELLKRAALNLLTFFNFPSISS